MIVGFVSSLLVFGRAVPLLRRLPATGFRRITSLTLATVGVSVLLGGCANREPRSAGHTPVASAPVRLWPNSPPAPWLKPDEYGRGDLSRSPRLPRVPSGDIRKLDVLSVVEAQIAEDNRVKHPSYDEDGAKRISRCAAEPGQCPVRAPEYRDLTGDGKDELIVGIDNDYDHSLTVWVYRLENGVVTRVLNTAGRVLSLEVANGRLIMREPSSSQYEMRTVFAWNSHRRTIEVQAVEYDPKPSAAAREPGQ
ncbi:hypothetical protein ACFU7T_13345 [Streptomyces sp. NPDC057555]|uniref:hypothetical protein n=1 Tax=Streptomyces sp. NPDC057555 TaxID=3346166 RepID=UPI0036AA365F